MIRSTLTAALVVSLLSLAACGGAASPAGAGAASPASPAGAASPASAAGKTVTTLKEPGDAKIGDTTKCPVSGEEFVVDASSPKVEHAGKTYYMCCGGCKGKFEADPAKYLNKI